MHLILPLQGVFVRRHAVQRDDGSGPISPRDLAVDGDITIYGRTVHLIDADAFTRTWYADQLNVQLAPAIHCGTPEAAKPYTEAVAAPLPIWRQATLAAAWLKVPPTVPQVPLR